MFDDFLLQSQSRLLMGLASWLSWAAVGVAAPRGAMHLELGPRLFGPSHCHITSLVLQLHHYMYTSIFFFQVATWALFLDNQISPMQRQISPRASARREPWNRMEFTAHAQQLHRACSRTHACSALAQRAAYY